VRAARARRVSQQNRLLKGALQKLEASEVGGNDYVRLKLSEAEELGAFLRDIASYVRACDRNGKRRPRVFRYEGGSVEVRTFENGSVHICSRATGKTLTKTYPKKLW
jgi:hypothetical protein